MNFKQGLGVQGFRGFGVWEGLGSRVYRSVQGVAPSLDVLNPPAQLKARAPNPAWRFMGSYKWSYRL